MQMYYNNCQFFVIFFLKQSRSRFSVSSTSDKTGSAPASNTAAPVAVAVKLGIIISELFFNSEFYYNL